MSVIGIDFGNESCYVAVAKAGGIETIANDYSLRATPSFVAFTERSRVLGVAAKNQQITNMKNTVGGFKRLLGRKYDDPLVQAELRTVAYNTQQQPDGGIGIKLNYLQEEHIFTPEQITAMLFTKLKDDSCKALNAQINDCVITVPSYFTNAERQALLDAIAISGLKVLRLMNESTATALSYGFYKQDLPEDKPPRNVVFVDFGHASLQVSVCAFQKGQLKMLACCADHIGGKDFDAVLAERFSQDITERYKVHVGSNKRAYLRLLTECEKLKKNMSANNTKLPLNIECLIDEIDVSLSMDRAEFEGIAQDMLKRVEATMRRVLEDAKLTPKDIHSVEIVGGSTRIPAVKHLIEEIFGMAASTTLNQDEAVARGAALQCAILSPAVRVREFNCTDAQAYPVLISWNSEQYHEMKVFEKNHAAPFTRLLTLQRKEPLLLTLQYEKDSVPYPDRHIGTFLIKDIKPTPNGDPQEVKVKVRIDSNGIIQVNSATMLERKESEEPPSPTPAANGDQKPEGGESADNTQGDETMKAGGEPMDIQEGSDDEQPKKDSKNNDSSGGGEGWTQRVSRWFTSGNKKKVTTKSIDLQVEPKTHGFNSNEIMSFHELELKMSTNDRHENERIDARNALEEFVYDMRDKMQESGELFAYVESDESSKLFRELEDIENWLYDEGELMEKAVYKDKLSNLRTRTDPIRTRCEEYTGHAHTFVELGHAIQQAKKAIELYRKKDPKYDHLLETEILNIEEATQRAEKWHDESLSKLMVVRKTQDPPVRLADIKHETQTLSVCMNSVLSRPKPKPPTPPADQQNGPASGADQPNADQKQQDANAPKQTTEDSMDVE